MSRPLVSNKVAATALVLCACIASIDIYSSCLLPSRIGMTATEDRTAKKFNTTSCTDFRRYPSPEHHTGLPYLGDVFASADGQFVNFIGMDRGICHKEWVDADGFDARQREAHRFVCVFDGNIHVISEYVHQTHPFHNSFNIRCKIPQQFQHLLQQGQIATSLHVDLQAIEDLEMERVGPMEVRPYPSSIITETPALKGLPICHPLTSPEEISLQPKQFKLTAWTRIKSEYALDSRLGNFDRTKTNALHRVVEWLEYHKYQGFDHFIVYDNDAEPHGPIEELLKPYIEKGLVSYRWFPLEDCYKDHPGWEGFIDNQGQVVAGLSVLHRRGFTTEFLALMDIDEFFVPLASNKTVLDFVQEGDKSIDVFVWKPTQMAPCNGTVVTPGGGVLSKWKCLTDSHRSDVKMIMRPSNMMYYAVHYHVATMDWQKPSSHVLNATKKATWLTTELKVSQDIGGEMSTEGLCRMIFTRKLTTWMAFWNINRKQRVPSGHRLFTNNCKQSLELSIDLMF